MIQQYDVIMKLNYEIVSIKLCLDVENNKYIFCVSLVAVFMNDTHNMDNKNLLQE